MRMNGLGTSGKGAMAVLLAGAVAVAGAGVATPAHAASVDGVLEVGFTQTGPQAWEPDAGFLELNTGVTGGRGLIVTANTTFNIGAIDLLMRVNHGAGDTGRLDIWSFAQWEGGAANDGALQPVATREYEWATNQWEWQTFVLNSSYTFLEGEDYVIHFRDDAGGSMPSDAYIWLGAQPPFTTAGGAVDVLGGTAGSSATAFAGIPLTRFHPVPSPSVATGVMIGGLVVLMQRRRRQLT